MPNVLVLSPLGWTKEIVCSLELTSQEELTFTVPIWKVIVTKSLVRAKTKSYIPFHPIKKTQRLQIKMVGA